MVSLLSKLPIILPIWTAIQDFQSGHNTSDDAVYLRPSLKGRSITVIVVPDKVSAAQFGPLKTSRK